jgi:hypothetical protein
VRKPKRPTGNEPPTAGGTPPGSDTSDDLEQFLQGPGAFVLVVYDVFTPRPGVSAFAVQSSTTAPITPSLVFLEVDGVLAERIRLDAEDAPRGPLRVVTTTTAIDVGRYQGRQRVRMLRA